MATIAIKTDFAVFAISPVPLHQSSKSVMKEVMPNPIVKKRSEGCAWIESIPPETNNTNQGMKNQSICFKLFSFTSIAYKRYKNLPTNLQIIIKL